MNGGFDVVLGNPPYGADISKQEKKNAKAQGGKGIAQQSRTTEGRGSTQKHTWSRTASLFQNPPNPDYSPLFELRVVSRSAMLGFFRIDRRRHTCGMLRRPKRVRPEDAGGSAVSVGGW